MQRELLRLLVRLLMSGIEPDDRDSVRFKKSIINGGWWSSALFLCTLLGPVELLLGRPRDAAVTFGYAAFGTVIWLLYRFWHRNTDWFLLVIAITAPISHLLGTVVAGSFLQIGGLPIWGLFFPAVGMLVVYGARQGLVWFVVFVVNCAASIWLPGQLNPNAGFDLQSSIILLVINVGIVSTLIFGVLTYFVIERNRAFGVIEDERERAESLLLNILPAEIAAILKAQPRTIAESFEGASILFADVVNFTPMSAQMTPIELVELLNEVFSHFDTLTEKYGLEKIKTIGDCYMVASGVPRPRTDHAEVLTRMALEMQQYVDQRTFSGRRLQFRIGVNSGPVVAGVIGRKKFIYDLWGDAVNTASRMESHGAGGIIQITRSTYDLIKDTFICEPRGVVQIKGKGEMEVWQVIGAA